MNLVINDEKIKNYLLGNLSEDESKEIDLLIISDKNVEETFLIAEDSLIEDFLEGELSNEENDLFQKNYLISTDRKQKIETINSLKVFANRNKVKKAENEQKSTNELTFFEKLSQLFSLSPIKAAAAVFVLMAALSSYWFLVLNQEDSLSASENEFATINKKSDLSDLSKYKEKQINLTGGVSRSLDSLATFDKEDLTQQILIRIALPAKIDLNSTYNIELMKDKNILFRLNDLKVYKNEVGEELRFLIPSEPISVGLHRIEVIDVTKSEPNLSYSFLVK